MDRHRGPNPDRNLRGSEPDVPQGWGDEVNMRVGNHDDHDG